MSALRLPRAPAVPTPVRWTIAEFLDLASGGAFGNRKVMLIRGEVVEMAALKEPHNCGVSLTTDALRAAFGSGFYVRPQMSFDLGDSEPEPDVLVVPGAARDYTDLPDISHALLVVEVADTSFDYDRTVKAELFAEAGVADYWVLDLNGRGLLVLRDPAPVAAGGFAYRTHRTLGEADAVAPLAAPGSLVRVADLLPRREVCRMSAPPHPRPTIWTVAEFHKVRSSGVWDGRRAILIKGAVWELGPMNPPHAVLVELATDALRAAFGTGWRARVQLPLVLGQDTDPFPDVAMVPGSPRDSLAAHPTTAALVVEVADTTLKLDLTEKAELYAAAGIADYWIIDVNGRRLLVFRDPTPVAAGGHSYRTRLTLGPTDSVSPLAAPAAAVRVADLLP